MRTLIAGVGYSNLRDLSLGPILAAQWQQDQWPPDVEVDDLSYGPIAVVQRLEDARPPFDRLVLVGAVDRGIEPGSIRCYRWDGSLPGPEEIQLRIAQAITGVVDLDNLLVVAKQFGALPQEVFVIEAQPFDSEFGMDLSVDMMAQVPAVSRLVRSIAGDGAAADRWPVAGRGGLLSVS